MILAAGPVLGAAVGVITNLITSTWSWWLFSALVVLVSLAAGVAVFASSHHHESPEVLTTRNEARTMVCTLPAGIAVFVGRSSELSRFSEEVESRVGRPVVYAITGSPGIGKTELATQAAYRLIHRYPDGQLFLSFRSHAGEASRIDVAALLADALDSVSSDFSHNSLDATQLSSRWRAVTNNKRFLIILDDVEDASQVRPLMPNSPDCAVIITSREEISGIDPDILVMLGGLAPEEGEAMIAEITRRASRTVNRDVIRSLARMHHLPLTLRHVADQLVATSNRSSHRQSALGASDDPAEIFRETVNSLTATEKLVFRRAALYPGPHVTAVTAGALASISSADAESALNALYQHGLVVKPDPYGYAFHDLVRSLALEEFRTQDTERDKTAARERLFEVTTEILGELNTLISAPCVTRASGRSFGATLGARDEYEALTWLGNYFEDFRAIARLAINREWSRAWRLTDGLAYFMRISRNIPQAIELMESALQIAIDTGDELGQAVSYFQIAVLQRVLSNYASAEEYIDLALAGFIAMNDLLGQARCCSELGHITQHLARYPDSLESTNRALTLFAQLNDRAGVANSRGALGMVNRLLGDYNSARAELNQALDLYREMGNPRNQAWILIELGTVDRQTGDYDQARKRFIAARDFFDRAGDRSGHAWAERELGIVSRMTGDYPTAKNQLSDALKIFADIGSSKRNIADAHIELGALYRVTGALSEARDEAHLALRIYHEIGNVRGAAWAGLECGAIEQLQGGPRAAEYLENSLEVYERIGDRSGLARAYLELGILAVDNGDLPTARERLNAALERYESMDSPESAFVRDKLATLDAT